MTHNRFGMLAALTLALVLGACSTPADLTSPALEPQFGSNRDDTGIDVKVAPGGGVYELWLKSYEDYVEVDWDDDLYYSSYETLTLDRYDTAGKLVWSKRVAAGDCFDGYGCNFIEPRSLHTDAQGNAYVFFLDNGDVGSGYQVHKLSPAGTLLSEFWLDDYDVVDVAVDGSGSIYYVGTEFDYDPVTGASTQRGVVTKRSSTNTVLWKRTLTIGEPRAVTASSTGSVFVGGTTGISRLTSAGDIAWTKPGATSLVAASGTSVYARNLTTIRKLDVNGKPFWSKAQSGLSSPVVADMTTDSNGNLYLAGKYNASSTNRNPFVRKLTPNGGTVFTRTFGTSAYDDARGVATVTGAAISTLR